MMIPAFRLREARSAVLLLMVAIPLTSVASADIVKVKVEQKCAVDGLDASAETAQGGVHCDDGNPFSLSDVLDGSIQLFVGDSQTPSWNLINDTGGTLTSLSLYYIGMLASDAYIDMQRDDFFKSCTATTADGLVTFDPKCGSKDKTAKGSQLPVLLVWSGGKGIADGEVFNLATASFAHGGKDAGYFSGIMSVPEPNTLTLLASGLFGLALIRKKYGT